MARYLLMNNDGEVWQTNEPDHEDWLLIKDGSLSCFELIDGVFYEHTGEPYPINVPTERPEAEEHDWEDDDDYDGTIHFKPNDED